MADKARSLSSLDRLPTPLPGARSLNRILRATAVALLASVLGVAGAIAPVAAATRVPKVALIVGPSGQVTASYRKLADQAGTVAASAGAEVVKVYSPNATWDAVQGALTGASIVVYLGHGNGWPSRYRDALYPPTQDGFGLNPVAGVDDDAHQYFGEAAVQRLHLAPNAVVLLSHLCYASGNTEPGLAEGTRDQSIQRVDNYAAGFLVAGAAAVVAEAHMGPAYYVAALLRGRVSIEATWQASPSANGNTFKVASGRSPGFIERLDPDSASGGYYRSLVSRGVTAEERRAGSTGTGGGTIHGSVVEPSLAGHGLSFGEPEFASLPIAATRTRLTLPVSSGTARQIPARARAGVRWDPILLDDPSASAASPVAASPAPSSSPTPSPTPTTTPTTTPGPTPSPSPSPSPSPIPVPTSAPSTSSSPSPSTDSGPSPAASPVAPPVDLVVPEQLGAVVDVVPAVRTPAGLRIEVTYPTVPGLYRLVVTLHTPSGTAYDASTQALLVPVIVRVGGPVAAAYGAPASIAVSAGSVADVAVRVVNAGAERWDRVVPPVPLMVGGEPGLDRRTTLHARLVATWVSADGQAVPRTVSVVLGDEVSAPGGSSSVNVPLTAPSTPGSYLVLLDVLSPSRGPLSALGSAPAIIRVSVGRATSPAPIGVPAAPIRPG